MSHIVNLGARFTPIVMVGQFSSVMEVDVDIIDSLVEIEDLKFWDCPYNWGRFCTDDLTCTRINGYIQTLGYAIRFGSRVASKLSDQWLYLDIDVLKPVVDKAKAKFLEVFNDRNPQVILTFHEFSKSWQ